MKIINDTLDFRIPEKSAVTLGKFDGIHKGHQKLMRKILEKKAQGLKSVVFTFDAMPGSVFLDTPQELILTREERRRHFQRMGIDYLIEYPFTDEVIRMEPEQFIKSVLKEQIRTEYIAAGEDFRFGCRRKGDGKFLKDMALKYGYEAEILTKECLEGQVISSSVIREMIKQGMMEQAAGMLGYPYYVSGTVIHGHEIGRTLEFPTINVLPEKEKLLPPHGVYLTKTLVEGQEVFGITNLGVKPTISGKEAKGVETHLIDFSGDLYGHKISTEFYAYERKEQKFESLVALKNQLKTDLQWAEKYLQEHL